MKKFSKFLCLPVLAMILSGCNLLSSITNDSDGYEDYFTNELKFTKFTDVKDLNKEIFNKAYFWDTKTESDKYDCYHTSKSHFIYIYKGSKKILCAFQSGESVTIEEKDGAMKATTGQSVSIDEDGNKTGTGLEEYLANIEVAKYEDGWLFFCYQKFLVFIGKDYKSFYICEENTKEFAGFDKSIKTVADSELLTSALNKLGKEKRVELPAPLTGEYEMWAGTHYYKDNPSQYDVYIAGVSPQEYAEILKKNGFTVTRSFEDPFYTFYQNNGGYWYCTDEKMEMKIVLKYQDYLYTNSVGKTFGPTKNTFLYIRNIIDASPRTTTKTTEEDWSDYDKSIMAEWYDGSIDATKVPFPQIAKSYGVTKIMSYAHEGLMDGTLKLHSQCYNITDNSPVYFLGGYDQKLEAAGFHKYVPAYDLSTFEGRSAFQKIEECKYVECFINDEEDIAVKYYFDVINGNTVRVFKKSEMKSWLQDEK